MGVNKTELIKMIEDAIALEDKSIQIYRKHLGTAIFWSGLTEWGREQLRIALDILAQESARHERALASLKARVESGGKDVY